MPVESKPAIVLCDATYVYVQTSSNYLFQKQTYSLHKHLNLVKPFMIVCCNGHILDCIGQQQMMAKYWKRSSGDQMEQ